MKQARPRAGATAQLRLPSRVHRWWCIAFVCLLALCPAPARARPTSKSNPADTSGWGWQPLRLQGPVDLQASPWQWIAKRTPELGATAAMQLNHQQGAAFFLSGQTRARIRRVDDRTPATAMPPRLLRVVVQSSALGPQALAVVEEHAVAHADGSWSVWNYDLEPSFWLLAPPPAAEEPAKWLVEVVHARQPQLAFDDLEKTALASSQGWHTKLLQHPALDDQAREELLILIATDRSLRHWLSAHGPHAKRYTELVQTWRLVWRRLAVQRLLRHHRPLNDPAWRSASLTPRQLGRPVALRIEPPARSDSGDNLSAPAAIETFRLQAGQRLELDLDGPGKLDIDVRSLVPKDLPFGATLEPATLQVSRGARRLAEIAIARLPLRTPSPLPSAGSPPPTWPMDAPPIAADAQHWLGSRRHLPIELEPQTHRYTLQAGQADVLVALTLHRMVPQVAARRHGTDEVALQRRLIELQGMIRAFAPASDPRPQVLHALMAWTDDAALRLPRLQDLAGVPPMLTAALALAQASLPTGDPAPTIAALRLACDRLRRGPLYAVADSQAAVRASTRALLAEHLHFYQDSDAAHDCLDLPPPIVAQLAQPLAIDSQAFKIPRLHGVVQAQAVARSLGEVVGAMRINGLKIVQGLLQRTPYQRAIRELFFELWRTSSTWRSLTPPALRTLTPWVWLSPTPLADLAWAPDRELLGSTDTSALSQVGATWRALTVGQDLHLDVPSHPTLPDRWPLVLVVVRGCPTNAKSVQLLLDQRPHELACATESTFARFTLAPGVHSLRLNAPPSVSGYVDIPAFDGQAQPLALHSRVRLWPGQPHDGPLAFEVPAGFDDLPLRFDLLRLADLQAPSRKPGPLVLTLQANTGEKRRVWLHPLPTDQPSPLVEVAAPPAMGEVFSILLAPFAKARDLTVLGDEDLRAYALGLRLRGAATQELVASLPTMPPLAPSATLLLQQPVSHLPRGLAQALQVSTSAIAQAQEPCMHHVQRARALATLSRWSETRDELTWLLTCDRAQLAPLLPQIQALLQTLQIHRPSAYTWPRQAMDQTHFRLPPPLFLDNELGKSKYPPTFVDPTCLVAMRHPGSITSVTALEAQLACAVDYGQQVTRVAQVTRDAPAWFVGDRYLGLGFGLVYKVSEHLAEGPLVAANVELAAHTRWERLPHSAANAGEEWLTTPDLDDPQEALAREIDTLLLAAPWPSSATSLPLTSQRGVHFQIERQRPLNLEVRAFCRRKVPLQDGEPLQAHVAIERDRQALAPLMLDDGQMQGVNLTLTPGRHTLEINLQSPGKWRCAATVEAAANQVGGERTRHSFVPLHQERWWSAAADEPLALHVVGPTALRLQWRALADTHGVLHLQTTGPQAPDPQEVTIALIADPHSQLVRTPQVPIHRMQEHVLLLPHEGAYTVEVRPSHGEVLVAAAVRMPRSRPPAEPLGPSFARTWSASPGQPLDLTFALAPPLQPTTWNLEPRTPWGSLEVRTFGGFDQNEEIDGVRRRTVLHASAKWRRAWLADRLWSELAVSSDSEGFAAAAFGIKSLVTWRPLARSPFRIRAGPDFYLQPLQGIAMALSGRLRMDWPIVLGRPAVSPWRLVPFVEVQARWFSSHTLLLARSSSEPYLNSLIYREYYQQHPLGVTPAVRVDWLGFRGLRLYQMVRATLNSNFASLDRLDSAWQIDALRNHPYDWTLGWWQWSGGYNLSVRLADDDRPDTYLRHTLDGRLSWSWWWTTKRRVSIDGQSSIFVQRDTPLGVRLLLGLRFDLQTAGDFRHFAPQDRLFANELGSRWWTDRDPQSSATQP